MKHILGPNSTSSLTNVKDGDSQPNAVDLRLGDVFKIDDRQTFYIDDEKKEHRGSTRVFPDHADVYNLAPGSYEVVMENVITVGEGEAGFVITRSTLNRNGLFLTTGLYDTGYNGVMAAVLHVTSGPARIKKGTRIGQYLNFDAENLSSYSGDYGIGSAHDTKYGVEETEASVPTDPNIKRGR